MVRLTEHIGDGRAIPRMDSRKNGYQRCLNRLAEYEETGLTPEEIADRKLLTGWIPVEERLPKNPKYYYQDEMEEYIVTIEEAERVAVLQYVGGGEWCDTEDNFYRVTAWMPLPEVYKPEKPH